MPSEAARPLAWPSTRQAPSARDTLASLQNEYHDDEHSDDNTMASPDLQPILFFDIPGTASPHKAWSPNCWKARYALLIRRIPHRTIWIEYPHIEAEMRARGVPPTAERDGRALYTLPAVVDPNSGVAIADSAAIARYLETRYPSQAADPDVPLLFPPGTDALQLGFRDAFDQRIRQPHLIPLLLLLNTLQMHPPSATYFRETRERMVGGTLEALAPPGSAIRAARVQGIVDGLRVLAGWIDAAGAGGGPFVMGKQPCFADLDVAANLLWLRIVGDDGTEDAPWRVVAAADAGRWAWYLAEFDKWSEVF